MTITSLSELQLLGTGASHSRVERMWYWWAMLHALITGAWLELHGRLSVAWGRITHDNSLLACGYRQQVVGLVQRKCCEPRDVVEQRVDRWLQHSVPALFDPASIAPSRGDSLNT